DEPYAIIKQIQEDLRSAGKPWYPGLQVSHAASADAQSRLAKCLLLSAGPLCTEGLNPNPTTVSRKYNSECENAVHVAWHTAMKELSGAPIPPTCKLEKGGEQLDKGVSSERRAKCQLQQGIQDHASQYLFCSQIRPRYLWTLGKTSSTQGQIPSGSSQSLQPYLQAEMW
ncbi:hypothetical protein STEG23_014983, partial [Scotinomys teguina]